ncbi:MAG: hypothetical protein WCR85_00060 [Sphaerochaeta sp.]
MSNGRTDQKHYAPIGNSGSFGAWRAVIFTTVQGEPQREEKIVVSSSLVALTDYFGEALMEAEYLGEGVFIVKDGGIEIPEVKPIRTSSKKKGTKV